MLTKLLLTAMVIGLVGFVAFRKARPPKPPKRRRIAAIDAARCPSCGAFRLPGTRCRCDTDDPA